MTNTTLTPNRSLNQIMSDDDASSFILKNKNALTGLVVGIVIAVVAFGLYVNFSDKSKAEFNSKIYAFEVGALKNYTQNHEAKAIVDAIKSLKTEVGNYPGLIPVVIKSSDLLMAQNQLNEALEVLQIGLQASKNEYGTYFVLNRLAVVYEDLGQDQKAIETLEKMNGHSVKIFEGKNYLDLGRLYLKKGDKDKAKASFNFVVEKAKDEVEFVRIAKLYLSKI
jgi:predicted negative regulator of RcsB-dependent stress response